MRRRALPLIFGWWLATTSASGGDLRASHTNILPVMDVLHYRIEVTLDMAGGLLEGRVTLLAQLNSAAPYIVLNAAQLSFNRVMVDGEPWTWSFNSTDETVTLHPPGAAPDSGRTVSITIDYSRPPELVRPGGRWGYYFFLDTLGIPSNLGYTMAEPSDTRFWLPCVDIPSDKATAELFISVPSGYVAASNGTLIDVSPAPGGRVVWHWQETHPIAPYLICITASQFSVASIPFERAPGDTIPVQYYTWPEDSAECAGVLPAVAAMMEGLGSIYGPYPFDKYGMTAIVPFGFGGMEHQTITTMNRYLKTDERVIVHELAHQWWGDLVTCATWKDVWLNESFATYSEALWAEYKNGREALQLYMTRTLRHFYMGSWQGGPYDPEGQGFNLFDDVVYSKGAWILHMLRGVIGDSAFFSVLERYRDLYAGSAATTEEFRAVAEAVAGKDLQWFFDEWVYGRGWPVYACSYAWAADTLSVRIKQEQSASWPAFTIPLPIRLHRGAIDTMIVITPNGRDYTTRIALSHKPDSMTIDPDDMVLKQTAAYTYAEASTEAPESFALEQNYPNPFNPTTNIWYSVGVVSRESRVATKVRLAVYDVLGREVAVLVDEPKAPGTYQEVFDGSGLASGMYIARLQAGGHTAVKTLLLIR